MLTAIVGINWGDEGKGRMVDLLCPKYDIVARYQGGNNAGHTVVNEYGKFILNLLPSGIFRPQTVNILGPGTVIDVEHLCREMEQLRAAGITVTPAQLKISEGAVICMPYHKQLDALEEDRLGDKRFGSTRRGIAPVYADRAMKKVLRMGDLLCPETLQDKVKGLAKWENLLISGGYKAASVKVRDIMSWLEKYGAPLREYISDTTSYLTDAILKEEKSVMFEGQLGALRDVTLGIYPYTTSHSTLAAYAPIGAGVPFVKLDRVIGIMKAYSTCVGQGPFACELFDETAEWIRKTGNEFGAATGRPRRIGGFDVPASRYGMLLQGATEIALTKLDVLSCCEKIPVCVAYEIDGEITEQFPHGERLNRAKPVYEYLDGWKVDISKCKSYGELPENAKKYIEWIQSKIGGVKIKYISVGPGRDEYIEL